jgi:hypothetical protein
MWRVAAFLVSAILLVSSPAAAETPGQRPTPPQAVEGWTPTTPQVSQQSRYAVDPWQSIQPVTPGITSGQWTWLPSVTAATFYDDNVFATHSNRQGSWGGLVRPELGVRTSGQNYAIQANGFVEGRGYSRFSSEDQVNGAVGLGALVMPDPDTQLVGKARYIRAHEDRGAGESEIFQGFDKPVGYDTFEASGAINKRFNRWWTSVGAAGTWVNYDTPTIGGVPQDQSYRDGNIGVLSGRVGYVVAPLTSVFVEASGNRRDFKVDNFDSQGYRVVGGVLLEPGPGARIKGEAFAGYMFQDYTGVTFNTISTFTYGGAVAWLIAPRWTAIVEGKRNALESGLNPTGAVNGGVSLIESLAGARLDYLVMPNLTVGAGASYLVDQFQGADRTDRTLSPLFSIKYLVNPFVTVGFDYRNVAFDSNGVGVSTYYRNVYLLSVNARL